MFLGYMLYAQPSYGPRWNCALEMVCAGFAQWRHIAQWFLDLKWLLTWHSSLGQWSSLACLVYALQCDHMQRSIYLDNILLGRRHIVHLEGGHHALDDMG